MTTRAEQLNAMSPPVSSDVNMTRASLPRLQLIVLLAATTILSFCSAPAGLLVNRKWTRLNSPLTSVTVITAARSVTECAEECLQCSGCVAFCKSATSPNCYLQSAGGAQVPLGDASGFKCFSSKSAHTERRANSNHNNNRVRARSYTHTHTYRRAVTRTHTRTHPPSHTHTQSRNAWDEL